MSVIESRIYTYYKFVLCQDIIYSRDLKNLMQLPSIVQCVLNSSSGQLLKDKSTGLTSQVALQSITGQKAKRTRSLKSIAAFQLRKGNLLGCTVNLRGAALYSFLDQYMVLVFAGNVSEKRKKIKFTDCNFGGTSFTSFPGLEKHFLQLSQVGGYNCTLSLFSPGKKQVEWLLAALQLPFF